MWGPQRARAWVSKGSENCKGPENPAGHAQQWLPPKRRTTAGPTEAVAVFRKKGCGAGPVMSETKLQDLWMRGQSQVLGQHGGPGGLGLTHI